MRFGKSHSWPKFWKHRRIFRGVKGPLLDLILESTIETNFDAGAVGKMPRSQREQAR